MSNMQRTRTPHSYSFSQTAHTRPMTFSSENCRSPRLGKADYKFRGAQVDGGFPNQTTAFWELERQKNHAF